MKTLNNCIQKIGFNITGFAMEISEKIFDITTKIYLSSPVGSITRNIFFRLNIKSMDLCLIAAKYHYIYFKSISN